MSTEENAKQNASQVEQGLKIVKLVRALNEFDGLHATINTGTVSTRSGSSQNNAWSVCVEVEQSETGWFLLEFLAWLINNDFQQAGMEVHLVPYSRPPYLNIPGRNLILVLEGSCPPEQVAETIQRARKECYVPPSRLHDFILDSYGLECLETYLKRVMKKDQKKRDGQRHGSEYGLNSILNRSAFKNLPAGVIRFHR